VENVVDEQAAATPISLTAIILIVVVSVLVIAVIIVVVVLVVRRNQMKGIDEELSGSQGPLVYNAGTMAGSQAWYPSYAAGSTGTLK
jgi:uncharacterized membrane protein YqiK